MIKSNSASDYIWWMKKQYPMGVTTFSECSEGCGHSARGGMVCGFCLEKELAKFAGEELASEFHSAIRKERELECAILEAAGEL